MQKSLSFILPHEEEEVKKTIIKELGFTPMQPPGIKMLVKLFVRDEDIVVINDHGKEVRIIVPETVSVRDAFRSCTALVIAQGPDCYKSERFKKTGPWCKVGDFVCMPRNEGLQIIHQGVVVQIIDHDDIYHPVERPDYVHKFSE